LLSIPAFVSAAVFVVVVILILEEDGDVQLKSEQRYCAHLSTTDRQTYIHQIVQQIAGAFHSGGDYQVVNCSKGCMYASLL
jgi:hypothetical protein